LVRMGNANSGERRRFHPDPNENGGVVSITPVHAREVQDPHDLTSGRIIVMGDSCCGKSCIVNLLANGSCDFENYSPTIGGMYIRFKETLYIWDVSGDERYKSLYALYGRNAAVVMLVASATDPESVEHLNTFPPFFEGEKPKPLFICVLNKMEMVSEGDEIVKKFDEIASSICGDSGAYFHVSAKIGTGFSSLSDYFKGLTYHKFTGDVFPICDGGRGGGGGVK